ncbi:TPR-repeat-containing protein [Lysobacter dokdonensis DS-58]|uniref:TPR-repeat-containing protein n=1 Tax=Lysobacter dokdonensis DS-58 TaxID=1300345 RepID=A0A0A2X0S8_9GAMM|nr:hypothetical protein [Lysobacter dokdonensis]KGQ18844.1 TPR-repeat-containing protein [Lysobacter dokdonensis DS-58]
MRSTTTLLALLAACAATCWAYAAGLHGGFLFDDWVNLDTLGATGPVDDWATFWRYITSGAADPTGRPLALLSFLVDANDWPADPAPFLRTNLVLHLVNGALLFALLRMLGTAISTTPSERTANAPALIAATAWLLHPLFVSTTLYVVQREAMLSALFVLLGLLAYGHGRLRFAQSPRAGVAWMLGGLAFGTLLALACKANGILLPLLAWVLEATLFGRDGDRRLRTFRIVFLVLPSVLLFAWLALHFARYAHAPLAARDWTIAQRLLTEPRVLVDYLQLLFVPRAMSNGLFNDAYAVSTGWLQPWTTLAAWCVVSALIAGAIALRRRAPAVSAAVLFFFAGHLIESSVLALELYYEHRNYLPAMLAFWPLARALCAWKRPAWQRGAVAIAVLAMLAATTHARATLWGQPDRLATTWVALNPASPRAQATAAMADMKRGRADLAERRLAEAVKAHPRDLQLLLNLVDARCQLGGVDRTLQRQVRDALRNGRMPHALVFGWIDNAMTASPCFSRQHAVLATWIDQAAANPAMQSPPRRQDIAALRGRLALSDGDAVEARHQYDLALSEWPTPQAAARNAADLATRGHLALAFGHLDHYETLRAKRIRPRGFDMPAMHDTVLERQHYWDTELQRLRARLVADMERAQ